MSLGWLLLYTGLLMLGFFTLVTSAKYQVSGENITAIPQNIPQNTSNLQIRFTSIATVEEHSFANLRELIHLDLSQNQIDVIHTKAFYKLHNLSELNLSHNKLSDINYLSGLILDSLDLSYNKINLQKRNVSSLIHSLFIRENDITDISDLKSISRSFQELDVSGNNIGTRSASNIYSVISSLPLAVIFTFDNCNLTTFPDLKLLRRRFILRIDSNPLHCDCSLSWMKLTPPRISIIGSPQCLSPAHLRGMLLNDVTVDAMCQVGDDCSGMSIQPLFGPMLGGTNITVSGPCVPVYLHFGHAVLEGGTQMTVIGENFDIISNPKMNVTQLPIKTNGSTIFAQVEYPPSPCSANNDTHIECKTPHLELPSTEIHGVFTAQYDFVFSFDDYKEYQETNITSISFYLPVSRPPQVTKHHWPPYDAKKGEPLDLQIAWGEFQNQAVVRVGGLACTIAKRYDNQILFFPPVEQDVLLLNANTACYASPDSHTVDVQVGNNNQRAGCLSYAQSSYMMVIVIVASCVGVIIVVGICIGCYVKYRKRTYQICSNVSAHCNLLTTAGFYGSTLKANFRLATVYLLVTTVHFLQRREKAIEGENVLRCNARYSPMMMCGQVGFEICSYDVTIYN
ncbi:hypothetical protein CAPTEDRAFT_217834 [Capitella teleta]|uniref:LRRCT domain-containing protein n=1 Tax=Capitella teleta TaxID=283909 RepID=R7VGH5_CAPTE|nr:hypothetical protein CAPTEDRAFT_217834 [Capitella teleta]|eukprot:ELU17694.1 hypothetical protein CAPTEDRAFT_217834 [Capitella teleta]